MKKYLADILTLIRFVSAIILLVMAFTGGDLGAGFLVFIIGELTDAFDGTCATKWPFPKGKAPWYRKYAAKYDMYADFLLGISMAVFFSARVDLVAGLVILFGYGTVAFILDLIIYGKFMGHPDDFKKFSLMAHNFKLARRLVLARRMVYLALVALAAAWTFYASSWPLAAKIIITIIATIVSIYLWFYLAQRRHHISRDAVDIEQKLSK